MPAPSSGANQQLKKALAAKAAQTSDAAADAVKKLKLKTSKFGSLNLESSTYRYPYSNARIEGDTDYVTFEFFKYKPPFKGTGGKTKADEYDTSIDFTDSENILGDKAEFGKNIIMYMPEDIQSEYGANWSGAGFGFLAGRLMKAAGGNFDLGQTFKDFSDSARKGAVDFISNNANKAMGSGVTSNQALGGITGTIVNPNVEMMYESPEMRTFSLTYKMFASNEEETKQIRAICNTFKKNMLPSFGGGAFIGVPNVVRVTFMTGSSPNPFVSQFKPCAISNVSINYTPDGSWSSYEGGAPVATNITINFKELKMLFAEDINIGAASF
jgi:hypothetical protein